MKNNFENKRLSRRDFLKWGAYSAALLSLTGLIKWSMENSSKNEGVFISQDDLRDDKKYPPKPWGEAKNLSWDSIERMEVSEIAKSVDCPAAAVNFLSVVDENVSFAKDIFNDYVRSEVKIASSSELIDIMEIFEGRESFSMEKWFRGVQTIVKKKKIIGRYLTNNLSNKIQDIMEGEGIDYSISGEKNIELNSPLYQIYASVIVDSNMSNADKYRHLTKEKQKRVWVPYTSSFPLGYQLENSEIEGVSLFSSCQSIAKINLPVCRHASYALMKMLHKHRYSPLELKLRKKEHDRNLKGMTDIVKLIKNEEDGIPEIYPHVVYLVKGIDSKGKTGYGLIGFNQFDYEEPRYSSVDELFEKKYSGVFDYYKIVDNTKLMK